VWTGGEGAHNPQADFPIVGMPGHDEYDDTAVLLAEMPVSITTLIDSMQAVSKRDQEIGSFGRSRRSGRGLPRTRKKPLNLAGSDREGDLNAPLNIGFDVAKADKCRYFECLHRETSKEGNEMLAEGIAGQYSRYVVFATFSDTNGDEPHEMATKA
jgi:hypothetical protein